MVTATAWNEFVDNWVAYETHTHSGVLGQGAGTLTLADGSVGAPSLSNTGDTNTGLYFSAADEISVSLGGTARLTLDTATRGNAFGTWTPTWSGGVSAIGDATVIATYWRLGKMCMWSLIANFGPTTTFAAATIVATLPFTGVTASGNNLSPMGPAVFQDSGTTQNTGVALYASTTTMNFRVNVAGSALVTNLVPHTWANTDVLYARGFYEVA